VADLFGDLSSTGWTGDGPFGVEAYLMLYPTGSGQIDPEMGLLDLAQALGLEQVKMPQLDPQQVAARVGDGRVALTVQGSEVLARPVDADWSDTARRAGRVVLILAMRTPGGLDETSLDALLGDSNGRRCGLVQIKEGS